MHVHIIIRWSRRESPGHSFPVRSILKRLRCFLGGHDEEVVLGGRAMSVRCRSCGWKSPGLTLDVAHPRR